MSEKQFVGYEYNTVNVPKNLESLWSDSMTNFGWELTKSEAATVKRAWGPIRLLLAQLSLIPLSPFKKMMRDHPSETEVVLSFKRDKMIENRADLVRLQAQFESYARGIEKLEGSMSSGAAAAANLIGLAGTVLMAIAMFSYLAGSAVLMTVLAIPAVICWFIPYFVHKSMTGRKTREIEPQIEIQHSSIYDVCQLANGILAGA